MIIAGNLILGALKLTSSATFISLALLILNPYVFRYYLAVPGMINDLVFVLGLTVGILGLVKKNLLAVLGGLILAAFARQTAILLLPAFILW